MTKGEVLAMIRHVLSERMALPHLVSLDEGARLSEQHGLDSVRLLELLIHLELEHGLALPEDVALQERTGTLGGLADALLVTAGSRSRDLGGSP